MATSCVRLLNGVPQLFINDAPVSGSAYITYFRENACYEDFGKTGCRIFSIPVFFGDQTINPSSGIYPFEPGIFSVKGQADFSILDRQIQQVLDAVPEAVIFPRVNVSLPRWWEDENPEECCFTAPHDGPRRSCFASEKWYDQTLEFLRQFIDYCEKAPYAEHVCAYMLAGGSTEEWFNFDFQGGDGPAARRKFGSGADPANTAYRRFLSEVNTSALCRLAQETKAMTGRQKAVGAFYGYTFEVVSWKRSHHALRTVLNSPDVDFICSPDSYTTRLKPGTIWPFMLPYNSLLQAGKLYFCEYDTRTCLSKLPKEYREKACPPGTYEQPIWHGPATVAASVGQLRLNMARQLALGHASWWFDMWGGFFAHPEFMRDIAEFNRLLPEFQRDADRRSVAEGALWIDETSYSLVTAFDTPSSPEEEENLKAQRKALNELTVQGRIAAGHSGIILDYLEIGDFAALAARYRFMLFMIPAETPAVLAAMEHCKSHGVPFLVMKPGAIPSAAEIRQFAVNCGLHSYCDSGEGIWIGPHLAVIHAASPGDKVIKLPAVRQVKELFRYDDAAAGCADVISCPAMTLGETRLYRLD